MHYFGGHKLRLLCEKEAKKGKSLSQAEDFGDPKPAMKDLKRVLCGLEYLHTLAQAQPSPCLPHTT